MLLKDLPNGSRCFVDANVFYYHFVETPGLSPSCSEFVSRVEAGDVEAGDVAAFSAPHVLGEVVQRWRTR